MAVYSLGEREDIIRVRRVFLDSRYFSRRSIARLKSCANNVSPTLPSGYRDRTPAGSVTADAAGAEAACRMVKMVELSSSSFTGFSSAMAAAEADDWLIDV